MKWLRELRYYDVALRVLLVAIRIALLFALLSSPYGTESLFANLNPSLFDTAQIAAKLLGLSVIIVAADTLIARLLS